MNIRYPILALLSTLLACNPTNDLADAYGNFEAIEVMISAESPGRIISFALLEGDQIQKGQVIAVVDTTQLHLKKKQLLSGAAALSSKINTLEAQVRVNRVQIANLIREKDRIENLLEGGAATSKQQDDVKGQIALLEAQMAATETQKASVYAEKKTLNVQVQQVEDQIRKCYIRSPLEGVILNKFKEEGEMAGPGQTICKVANLNELILRAYISGNQLSELTTGGEVKVKFDRPEGVEETTGVVSWISPFAEFTPKIIQTREERVSLVYAIKVRVNNEGHIKIGMPGEVHF